MALYPGSENERRFQRADIQRLVGEVFLACGMVPADAELLAGSLVRADLRGVHSHGVMRVPDYVQRMVVGGVDPRGRPSVVQKRGAALVIDGGNCMGQIAGVYAMERAIERARDLAVGAVAVRNSNHCGAMDFYSMRALEHGMIGLATTNALPTMAQWGGRDKVIGMNPLSVAIPAGETMPFVLDIAFGATAHGKLKVWHQKGAAIPEGWAFDSDGVATTDAEKALTGLIQPVGAYKGAGMAVVMGVLASLLSGGGYGLETGNMADGPGAGRDSQFYMAIDISAFEDLARFTARVDGIVRQLLASRLAPGFDRVYIPGQMEAELAERYAREGIPLNEATVADLRAAAVRLGVATDILD